MAFRLDTSPHLPERYPDFRRRKFPVPTRNTFENQTQFTTLRVFTVRENRLVDWRRDLDIYTEQLSLGRVVWPLIYSALADNFDELVAEIQRRKLWLFDIWGHVPGSAPEGMWAHIVPSDGLAQRLRDTLGERFLGFDNGEQDGRYIGLYATQQCPGPSDRFQGYLNFHRHFRRLCDDMGNQLSVLTSLQFIHHFAREGNHLLLGAETAQALPNSQVYYSFIRGAGKQYGLLWFGNASFYNRWGYKSYDAQGHADGMSFGPEEGTSLSLLRRLLYSHILYDCSIVGFENGWIVGDDNAKRIRGESVLEPSTGYTPQLTPIGKIQADAVRWTANHGQFGPTLTPVALLLDVFSGWTVPRHLYVPEVFQTWGAMPYNEGDHLTHGVLSLLYPDYEDSGFFHNEQGFFSATPFGDIADTLLSDAPAFVLERYATIICAGEIDATDELRDKLDRYVRLGGHLVLTTGNASCLIEPLDADVQDDVVTRQHGKGKITLLGGAFGVAPMRTTACFNKPDRKLPVVRPLMEKVRQALVKILSDNQIIAADTNLATIICRDINGQYTVGVFNNTHVSRPIHLESRIGPILEQSELPLPAPPIDSAGYWPNFEGSQPPIMSADDNMINAGDVRIFQLRIDDQKHVTPLPATQPTERPRDRFLSLRGHHDITQTLLGWPTFFHHLDGIKIDWTYLRDRDPKVIEFEAQWIRRQSLRILIDFSPGCNFYPDLTLLDTFAPRYAESIAKIEDVLRKAATIGAEGVLFSLHRMPENHCDAPRAMDRFRAGVRQISQLTRQHLGSSGNFYLMHHPTKWLTTPDELFDFVDHVGEGIKAARHLGHDLPEQAGRYLKPDPRVGLLLAASATDDALGQWYDSHAPAGRLTNIDWPAWNAAGIPLVLDSIYRDWDQAYSDIKSTR